MRHDMIEAINWPEEMTPSRSPIHFTSEFEVAASPETIWSLLVDPKAWPSFYPGVEHVHLLDGRESLAPWHAVRNQSGRLRRIRSVQEFKPVTQIALGGFPKIADDSKAYQARINAPTAKGCHLWTEDTMQGHWVELAKKAPDAFWRPHEKLPEALEEVATERGCSRSRETVVR